jgi:hypothetical protein
VHGGQSRGCLAGAVAGFPACPPGLGEDPAPYFVGSGAARGGELLGADLDISQGGAGVGQDAPDENGLVGGAACPDFEGEAQHGLAHPDHAAGQCLLAFVCLVHPRGGPLACPGGAVRAGGRGLRCAVGITLR